MNPRTYVLSTEGMVKHAATSAADTFVVATETGILHRLHKEIPGRQFVAADDGAVCGYMKQITLEKVRNTLRDMAPAVEIAPDIAARARVAIDRMLAVPHSYFDALRPAFGKARTIRTDAPLSLDRDPGGDELRGDAGDDPRGRGAGV